MVMTKATALALAGLALVGIACTTFNNNAKIGHGGKVDEQRSLGLFWSSKPKYNGQRGDQFCYNVNVGSGTLCCDGSYDLENGGFEKGAVCYLEESFSCKDLHEAVFVPDGEITMDTGMIGKRAFPTIVTGSGFELLGDPSKGSIGAPFDYSIHWGKQNGIKTALTGDAPKLFNKKFLVSGWDETQEPSDHEIEWAGPSTVGLGGESFDTPVVLMKGGSGAMIYLDDQDSVLHGSGYRTPVNPEDGSNTPTKSVEFCFDYIQAAPGSASESEAESDLDLDSTASLFRDGEDAGNSTKTKAKKVDGEDAGNSTKIKPKKLENEADTPEEETPKPPKKADNATDTDEPPKEEDPKEEKPTDTDEPPKEEKPKEEDPKEEKPKEEKPTDTDEPPKEEKPKESKETEEDDTPPPPPPPEEEEDDDEKKDKPKEPKKEPEKGDASAPAPGIKGDPHIKKWDGVQYDFHGGCDLVMLQNPDFNNGQGLSINIRTKIEHWWSYIESAVIKIGDDTLEIKGGVEERRYWVNGIEGKRFRASRNLPFTIGGFPGRFRAINKMLTQFKLNLPNDQSITIKSAKNMLRIDMDNCSTDDFGNSLGLMGTFGEGVMMGRDRHTIIEDPNEFGMEWQVLSSEPQLFHSVEGPQHPQKCALPTTKTFLRRQEREREARMLGESLSREAAEDACAVASIDEFNDCVYDVMATNDLDMAKAIYSDA